jgi:hypothetical protein
MFTFKAIYMFPTPHPNSHLILFKVKCTTTPEHVHKAKKTWKEYVKVGILATVSRAHLCEVFLCIEGTKQSRWLPQGSQGSVAFQNRAECRETGL